MRGYLVEVVLSEAKETLQAPDCAAVVNGFSVGRVNEEGAFILPAGTKGVAMNLLQHHTSINNGLNTRIAFQRLLQGQLGKD